MQRVILPRDLSEELDAHLQRSCPKEDGAFLLGRVGRGDESIRFMVHELLLPSAGDWEEQGEHSLRPSGQWVSAVIGAAIETGSGVGFVHSHPNQSHPPSLSVLDQRTSVGWSASLTQITGRPFLSLVWTRAGMNGWVFFPEEPARHQDVDAIQIIGHGAMRWRHPPFSESREVALDDRQIRAIGELGNERLRNLHVALVGAGGTGSPTAEQLVRMGVEKLLVIDPDRITTDSNLRRVVGSRLEDLRDENRKVDVVARHLSQLGLPGKVAPLPLDVRAESAARALLDADLIISTTDTHGSRSFINQVATQYWIPLIDVGVRVGTSQSGAVSGMPADVRVVLPDTGCLWCRGQLDSNRIRAENLPSDERAVQIQEGYIQGVDEPQPSLTPLNYFAASLVLLTMLGLLTEPGPMESSFIADGWERYFAQSVDVIEPNCICHVWRGMADEAALPYLPTSGPLT